MNILLLGSGGREHALAWKMAASPLDGPAVLRARQCRHRPGGGMRRARPRRPRRGHRVLPGEQRSISSSSGRKHRCAPASSTTRRPPASRLSGRAARRRSSKAPRASPRICAAPPAYRPPPTSAFATPTQGQGLCARPRRADRRQGRRARRRQGRGRGGEHRRGGSRHRHDAWRRAWRRPAPNSSSRNFSTAKKHRSSRCATAKPRCRLRRRRTTSAPSTATRGRIPAAWAPIRRRRSSTPP